MGGGGCGGRAAEKGRTEGRGEGKWEGERERERVGNFVRRGGCDPRKMPGKKKGKKQKRPTDANFLGGAWNGRKKMAKKWPSFGLHEELGEN